MFHSAYLGNVEEFQGSFQSLKLFKFFLTKIDFFDGSQTHSHFEKNYFEL